MYSEGSLKDQTVPRSKKGINASPKLKGSCFKSFRGFEIDVVKRLRTKPKNYYHKRSCCSS